MAAKKFLARFLCQQDGPDASTAKASNLTEPQGIRIKNSYKWQQWAAKSKPIQTSPMLAPGILIRRKPERDLVRTDDAHSSCKESACPKILNTEMKPQENPEPKQKTVHFDDECNREGLQGKNEFRDRSWVDRLKKSKLVVTGTSIQNVNVSTRMKIATKAEMKWYPDVKKKSGQQARAQQPGVKSTKAQIAKTSGTYSGQKVTGKLSSKHKVKKNDNNIQSSTQPDANNGNGVESLNGVKLLSK